MSGHDESDQNGAWDIVSSVGITALAVAGARAAETRREDRLIADPYAQPLFDAAPVPEGVSVEVVQDTSSDLMNLMAGYLGVRSRVFDDFFARAAENGARQAVILASGLDTRAFRLDWPEDFRVFEIDQPKVLDFKESVLDELGVKPNCGWAPVPVDLRDDWETALRAAGFDPSVPTAWLAEGLLPYLPARAQTTLLSTVSALSAPGSQFAVEHLTGNQVEHVSPRLAEEAKNAGFDVTTLFNTETRADAGAALAAEGWTVRRELVGDASASLSRDLGNISEVFGDAGQFVVASRGR